mgnify:CR=1 FL=1
MAALLLCAAEAWAATLSGRLAYPGESIPPMTVVARERASGKAYAVDTRAGQPRYQLNVPAGSYELFAIPRDAPAPRAGQAAVRGAHTSYSICARDAAQLNAGRCQTGPLILVRVPADAVRSDLDIDDWFMPDSVVATLDLPAAGARANAAGPLFADYPLSAGSNSDSASRRAPDFSVAPAAARPFRTQIERAAAAGPAFAGRVAVGRWGCGTRCENWALVDLASGRIVWVDQPELQPLLYNFPCDAQPLEFRLDSRLLLVHRVDGERVLSQGFVWSNEARRLERLGETSMPVARFCGGRR